MKMLLPYKKAFRLKIYIKCMATIKPAGTPNMAAAKPWKTDSKNLRMLSRRNARKKKGAASAFRVGHLNVCTWCVYSREYPN